MDLKKIGRLIKRNRKSIGMSQCELGKIAGVSGVTVGEWENGNLTNKFWLNFTPICQKIQLDPLEVYKDSRSFHHCKENLRGAFSSFLRIKAELAALEDYLTEVNKFIDDKDFSGHK